jgi:tryptophan synthase beta subunit
LQNHLQYVVNQNLLDEANLRKLKNGWNSARDSYASVMQDWAKTCDKTNHELGEYIGPAHYPPLRTLE